MLEVGPVSTADRSLVEWVNSSNAAGADGHMAVGERKRDVGIAAQPVTDESMSRSTASVSSTGWGDESPGGSVLETAATTEMTASEIVSLLLSDDAR